MFDWASEFGALVVFAEHRYYGESLPFGKDSFTVKSLLLTVVHCIQFLRLSGSVCSTT